MPSPMRPRPPRPQLIAAESMSVSVAERMPQDTVEPGAVLETAAAGTESGNAARRRDATGRNGSDRRASLGVCRAAIATETIAEHDNEGAMPSPDATSARRPKRPATAAQAARTSTTGENPSGGAHRGPRPQRSLLPPPLPKRKPAIAPAVPGRRRATRSGRSQLPALKRRSR
jgi:hypothetical protein